MVADPVARAGSLTIVGAGIRPGLHTTREAIARIKGADKVLYLLAEIAPIRWLQELNPSAESMEHLYRPGRPFAEVYDDIATTILDHVREGLDVCVVFYGHPGVFDRTSYDAVARARAEGFSARILPGITAEDCLYVDLELDPGATGCQSYDATDFLVRHRRPDVTVPLILWQVGVVGGSRTTGEVRRAGLEVLAERLEELYGARARGDRLRGDARSRSAGRSSNRARYATSPTRASRVSRRCTCPRRARRHWIQT